ncbi:MAG: ATP-dependent DNA helicase [Bryobacteraceae bacterium]
MHPDPKGRDATPIARPGAPPLPSRLTTKHFFARNGLLGQWHPNYEFRQGQLEMALAVEASLAERRHLIVEAGTGTGKTLAYLIPAILAGKRVIVSTGTKALQEQLYFKDVPFLADHFDKPLSVCYMKGRSNYACRQKIYDAEREPVLTGLEEVADFQIIREWERSTVIGDRAEITTLPPTSSAWAKVDARREMCTGQKCQQFERCFITEMMRRARESDIIIVNHHLFFADLALKNADSDGVLPDYDAVVFDEAHELEDIAGQYFGVSVSNYQLQELRRDIAAVAQRKNFGSAELDRVLTTMDETAARFFAAFPDKEGRAGFADPAAFVEQNRRELSDMLSVLELTHAHLELIKNSPEEIIPLARRALGIASDLRFWTRADDNRYVYWSERRGRGMFLEATPIDVSSILSEKLFTHRATTILTSATLAVQGSFAYVEERLGLRDTRSLIVESHFDYQTQALLYVPQHLPDPRSPAFLEQAVDETVRLLEISRGRAFVLFTSYQQMRQFHDRISLRIEFPTLLQGTGPNNALIEEFRRTPHCVLFATASFWQGVDVPGEQLSCVIIDKLPFAVPSDPIVEARSRAIREAQGNPFHDYQVPAAAIALKQGFGRLIRGRADRGVLAILDNRITKQRYGQIFFDSLPDYGFTLDRGEVERFFDV